MGECIFCRLQKAHSHCFDYHYKLPCLRSVSYVICFARNCLHAIYRPYMIFSCDHHMWSSAHKLQTNIWTEINQWKYSTYTRDIDRSSGTSLDSKAPWRSSSHPQPYPLLNSCWSHLSLSSVSFPASVFQNRIQKRNIKNTPKVTKHLGDIGKE